MQLTMNDAISKILSKNSKDQALLIVGWGVTGKALSEFCIVSEKFFYVYDDKVLTDLPTTAFCMGQLTTSEIKKRFIEQTIIACVASPGVPPTHAVFSSARDSGIPIIGELELAGEFLKGDFIAVTGTNGKSTTVKLIHALLESAGHSSSLKGNIGSALITAVHEEPKEIYVVEESSYQLELIGQLRHKIAVCLNVTDDHLDRYASLREYAKAKQNVVLNSRSDDCFIYNADDAECLRMARECRSKSLPFSLVNHLPEGGFVDGETMVLRVHGEEHRFELSQCRLKGMHNLENMLASLLSVLSLDSCAAAVAGYRKTLKEFIGLPHRLELVCQHNGIEFYDDSKATNVGSVVMALASFDVPIVLIAGGRDKEGDYAPLKGLMRGKVKKLLLIGEARHKMQGVFKDDTDVEVVDTLDRAVRAAILCAESGDVVMLSPACSSFDQFKDYAHRGNEFQRLVKESLSNVV